MQSDSPNCRQLRARHDKQYWVWLSAKCAATDSKAAELSLYSILDSDLVLPHNTTLWSICSYECSHLRTPMNTQTYTQLLYACRGSRMPTRPFPTHTYSHPHRMKNACCKLSAGSVSLIPHYSPLSSSHRHPFSPSLLSHTHFLGSGLSIAWRCLVNPVLLYGTDTQLVVGALTRPKKKRLGLLPTRAVNRNRMGFIGLQGLSCAHTMQLICQGDPNCSPPSLWFVHASVCLQSRQSSI